MDWMQQLIAWEFKYAVKAAGTINSEATVRATFHPPLFWNCQVYFWPGTICQMLADYIWQIFARHICLWAVFIFLGCRFRGRWQPLSEEEMADCTRGRCVSYLRVYNLIPESGTWTCNAIPKSATWESTILHQSLQCDIRVRYLNLDCKYFSLLSIYNGECSICVRNLTVLSFNDDLPVSGTLRYQDPIFVQSNVGFYNVLCSIYVLVHLITW